MAASRRSSRRKPQLDHVDGVMMGRAAYQEPWRLLDVDPLLFGEPAPFASPKAAALALIPYIERELAKGVRLHAITRHVLGLFRSVPGARAFRRHLATEAVKPGAAASVMADALAQVLDIERRFVAHRGGLSRPAGTIMVLGYPIGEIVLLALWIAGAGILVGILAGLFGIGGGAIIVPVLYEVFRVLDVPEDVRMQLCIGTSLAIIVPTTIRSYIAHKKKGAVIPHVVRLWALPAIAGVAIGSVTATFAPAAVFKIAFVIFAELHRIKMLFGGERWNLGNELPGRGAAGGFRLHHRSVFLAGRRERRRGVERGAHALWPADAARGRRPRPASACRSPLPAPSATCWPAGRIWRNCRRCRSASCR